MVLIRLGVLLWALSEAASAAESCTLFIPWRGNGEPRQLQQWVDRHQTLSGLKVTAKPATELTHLDLRRPALLLGYRAFELNRFADQSLLEHHKFPVLFYESWGMVEKSRLEARVHDWPDLWEFRHRGSVFLRFPEEDQPESWVLAGLGNHFLEEALYDELVVASLYDDTLKPPYRSFVQMLRDLPDGGITLVPARQYFVRGDDPGDLHWVQPSVLLSFELGMALSNGANGFAGQCFDTLLEPGPLQELVDLLQLEPAAGTSLRAPSWVTPAFAKARWILEPERLEEIHGRVIELYQQYEAGTESSVETGLEAWFDLLTLAGFAVFFIVAARLVGKSAATTS